MGGDNTEYSYLVSFIRHFFEIDDLIFLANLYPQITMHSSEVAQIASQLVTSLGLQWDANDFAELSAALTSFRWI